MSIRIKKRNTKKGEFQQLKSLGEEIVSAVETRLLAGEPAQAIARGLHEAGHLLDMKESTLAKALTRYRSSELREKTLERIAGVQRNASISQIVIRLNAMDEMERLVNIQKTRHDKLIAKESTLPEGIILKDASSEGRLLKDMLMDLGKLQLETGILKKASKTVKGQFQGDDGELHAFEWTEEQEKLYQSIDMEEDETFTAEDV